MQKSRVSVQFEKLEVTRRQLLRQLEALDDTVPHYRPENKKWSIIQIIFHLNSSEINNGRYIMKKSRGGTSVPESTVISSLRSFLLTTALQYFKWKKPAVLPDPPENLDSKQVMQSWEETGT